MKLIIIIPKEKYHYIKGLDQDNTDYATTRMLYHAVKYGKPYLEKEPKKGEWIADIDGYTCSECEFFNANDDKFCPNCGADMRGE